MSKEDNLIQFFPAIMLIVLIIALAIIYKPHIQFQQDGFCNQATTYQSRQCIDGICNYQQYNEYSYCRIIKDTRKNEILYIDCFEYQRGE